MKHKNVEKLETMAQDFLQYRYRIYLNSGREKVNWIYYQGACDMLDAFGAQWRRKYSGDNTKGQDDDIKNYSHIVWFPSDDTCERLNEDAWKD